jgi:hypothetical protein
LSISYSSTAQTQKGRIQAGGDVSFSLSGFRSFNNPSFYSFTNASAAYFLTDFFAVGGSLGFSFSKGAILDDEQAVTTGISIGTTAAYYLGNQKAQPYVFTGISLNTNSNNAEEPRSYYRNRSVNLQLGAGYSIFIRDNLSIEIGFPFNYRIGQTDYIQYTFDPSGNYTSEEGTVNSRRWSFSNQIGFKIYLK